jgi:hypothetical protein
MCGGGMLQSGIRGMQQDREALKEFSLLVTICLLAYVSFLECTWQKNWEHG